MHTEVESVLYLHILQKVPYSRECTSIYWRKSVVAAYTGIICWAISLHYLSFSTYKKLVRNKRAMKSINFQMQL